MSGDAVQWVRLGDGHRAIGAHSDVIALVVLWRLCYKLSLRDLPEMFVHRGMCSATKLCGTVRPSLP